MGQNKSVYSIEIKGILSDLQSKLATAQKGLTQLGNNDAVKALQKKFEGIETQLVEIGKYSGQKLDQGGFNKLASKASVVNEELDNLLSSFREIRGLGKNELEKFFPESVAKNIQKAETAVESYEAALKSSKQASDDIEEGKKRLETIDKKLAQNQQEQTTLQGKIAAAAKKEADIKEKITKIQTQKADPKQAQNLEELTNAEREYQRQINSNKELITTYRNNMGELKTAQQQLETEYLEVGVSVEKLEASLKDSGKVIDSLKTSYTELRNVANSLGIEITDTNKEFSKADAEKLLQRLKNLRNSGFEQLDNSLKSTIGELKNCTIEQKKLTAAVDSGTQVVKEQDQALDSISSIQGRISQYIGMEGIVNALTRALRSAFETVKELDAQMTEMAVVTDLGIGDYWNQLAEHTERASSLGLAIKDVYEAETLYYQQGLKANQVTQMSTETLKMARIAGLSAKDATDKMTAALRGFNMELNEASAQRISDVYSELAAITASDVNEISDAMTKTASIASSAGMEFETTAAFLSQIIETTRESAETAGTALKTVIARFQELKKDPSEIGEVDGEVVDANKIETALRSVGVALRDANGQFRDLDDVFLELASKWNTLDTNTQRYVATIAAGSRQQSRFIAMMQDYNRTQELVSAANTSAGASNEQFEKTLDSLETKLNQLKNAWNTFTMGLMDNQLIKAVITALTGLLNAINKVFEFLDNIPVLGFAARLGLVVGSLVLLDKILNRFFVSMKNGNGILASAGAALRGYSLNQDAVRITTNKNIAAQKTEALTTYDSLIAKEMANKLSKKEAKQKVLTIMAQRNYIKSLSDEQRQRYYQIFSQEISNKATREEAIEKAKATIAEEYNTGAKTKGTKATLASMWATIKKTAAEKLAKVWLFLSAVGYTIKAAATGSETAATWLSVHADIAKAASTALVVAVVLLAIAAFAGLVAGILKLCGVFDSAEKRLESAKKELEATEEATKKVVEEYNNLGTALEELDSKYDTLEELRRGTEEWNKAVQETNDSVLDLIDTYPELADLVENKGGVLTIDTNSEEVRNIIQEKENQATRAKGALIGAKMNVASLNAEAEYELNHELIDDFSKRPDDLAGIGAGAGTTAGGIGIGMLAGSILGPAGSAVGAIVGGIIGGIAGVIGGIFTGQAAEQATLVSDKIVKKNIDTLSKAYAKGEAGTTRKDVINYIEKEGLAEAGKAAEEMAEAFFENKEELLEYGRTLNETETQQKAYYQSIAANAQQMIDLGSYTQEAVDQMNEIVDEDITKAYYEAEKKLIDEMSGDELEQARREFAKSVYGSTARVDGNEILDELGNTLMTFENDEGWAAQMAAAKATQKAADAMQKVPGMIQEALKMFLDGSGKYLSDQSKEQADAIEKALSGQSLTRAETSAYQAALGNSVYEIMGKDYSETVVKETYNSSEDLQNKYGTYENFVSVLDEDLTNVRKMWEQMSDASKKVFNDDYELFESQFKQNSEKFSQEWSKTNENLGKLGIDTAKVSYNIASDAAQAWTTGLLDFAPNKNDIAGLNDAYIALLSGLSQEDAKVVTSTIQSIDQMDINAWEELPHLLENSGIEIASERLDSFIQKAIEVTGAIEKIEFEKLADDINETQMLLDKVREGGRKYSEEDYQKFIDADNSLEKSFAKVGDQFLYVGDSIHDLEKALQEDTINSLDVANKQLQSIAGMAEIIDKLDENRPNPSGMNREQLINYLGETRREIAVAGYNLADFGIAGLDNDTLFSSVQDEGKLKEWAMEIARRGINLSLYQTDYAKGMREANILRYMDNDSLYNAKLAGSESEYADQHAEALIRQAIQSGGVSEALIESYRKALKYEDNDEILRIGQQISQSVDRIVEGSEGRDAYIDLINQVKDAIVELRQQEIDKLSEVNDSINEANNLLINKIQEQIDADRQARNEDKAEKEVDDIRSRLAYLGNDTSGVNALEILDLEQELAEKEQDLKDAKIDQALENLQNANEKAAEQRERQIDLLTQQLENDKNNGRITEEATSMVQKGLVEIDSGIEASATEMGKIIVAASNWESMSYAEQQNFKKSLTGSGVAAADWFKYKDEPPENTTGGLKEDPNQPNALYETPIDELHSVVQSYVTNNNLREVDKPLWGSALRNTTLSTTKGEVNALQAWWRLMEEGKDPQKSIHGIGYAGPEEGDSFKIIDFYSTSGKDTFKPGYDFYANRGGVIYYFRGGEKASQALQSKLDQGFQQSSGGALPQPCNFINYNGRIYAKGVEGWFKVLDRPTQKTGRKGQERTSYEGDDLEKIKAFKTGGLADFTGPAWLDGTKSKPEIVLNQKDSANFIVLKDILSEVLSGTGDISKSSEKQNGDNYFNIDINVEKLEDDYDVEQLADKIRRMIYDDATYRNVNTINLIR